MFSLSSYTNDFLIILIQMPSIEKYDIMIIKLTLPFLQILHDMAYFKAGFFSEKIERRHATILHSGGQILPLSYIVLSYTL